MKLLTDGTGNCAFPSWSPDGEWIAFTSARGGFNDGSVLNPDNSQPYGDIYVIRADASEVQLTDKPVEEGAVAWGPMSRARR